MNGRPCNIWTSQVCESCFFSSFLFWFMTSIAINRAVFVVVGQPLQEQICVGGCRQPFKTIILEGPQNVAHEASYNEYSCIVGNRLFMHISWDCKTVTGSWVDLLGYWAALNLCMKATERSWHLLEVSNRQSIISLQAHHTVAGFNGFFLGQINNFSLPNCLCY